MVARAVLVVASMELQIHQQDGFYHRSTIHHGPLRRWVEEVMEVTESEFRAFALLAQDGSSAHPS